MTIVRSGRPGEPPLRLLMRFAWLALLTGVIVASGRVPLAATPLLAVAAVCWVGWSVSYRRGDQAGAALALVSLGAAGAVLAVWSSVAIGLIVATAIAAGTAFDLRRAASLAVCGPVVLAAASSVHGWSNDLVFGGLAAGLAGLVGGLSRRQSQQQARQEARTELARELHDVLAHTLGALAVQLEAAEAVLESGASPEKLRALLRQSRRLVGSGIDEAASAVRALRDEPVAIAERIADLVAGEPVSLKVEGTPRTLPPEAGLALYRAAQEALTNARKHAPGAPASVSLVFRNGLTVVTVSNGPAAAPSQEAGGSGLGLEGMRERLELAGGRLEAAGSEDGWRVEAMVPA